LRKISLLSSKTLLSDLNMNWLFACLEKNGRMN
jgi:hypothetical protein